MSILNNTKTVGSVMLGLDYTPQTRGTTLLKEALEMMDQYRLGIVCITSEEKRLEGIITDGDIRRMLNSVQKPIAALMSADVINYAVKNPLTVSSSTNLSHAITLMGEKKIWDLPVVDNGKLSGLLHLHPAIEAVMGNRS
jgi:CBS domain-containing protein